jgi:hypothetical protein
MPQPDFFPRAPRLPLRAPLTVRSSPGAAWADGWTVNISRSGVLFRVPQGGVPEGDVEFVISLSKGALQGPGVPLLPDLHCRGRVIRISPSPDGQAIVAASIRRQSLKRVDAPAAGRGRAVSEPPGPLSSPPTP